MGKMNLTEEERQRRSELARSLHNQIDPTTGRRKFGGSQPGAGRPRKIRAAEIVAEEAQRNADKIVAALKDALDPKMHISVRLKAAREWIEMENKEAALQLQEDRDLAKLSQEELMASVAGSILRLAESGALTGSLMSLGGPEIIEGDVEEDVEAA